jgi:Contractile injection system tube protein
MKPQKALIRRLKPDGTLAGAPSLKVQFNPGEYTLSKANQIAEVPIPGLDSPILQFVRGQTETLAWDLFFDTTEAGTGTGATSVTTETDKFYDLIKIESNTHAPPILWITWGGKSFPGKDRDGFKCVVESVRQRYTMFDPTGVPLRAVVSAVLREYKSLAQQIHELNLKSADHTKAHVLAEGETLAHVAYAAYGRPEEWRRIAEANGVDDPSAVPAGAVLRIPRALP